MSNTLSLNFVFNRSEVRTLIDGDIIWFVGKDVATILGYSDTDQALRKNVEDEDKLTRPVDGSGQSRNMILINEAGVYSLILSSTLPAAKQFKHWVTHEVLPSIRKQGFYSLLTKEKLIEVLTDKQREDSTYLDCIDKQAIKRQLLQETREKKVDETRKLWIEHFNDGDTPSFARALKEIWAGDMPMYHKYLDKYHSDLNKKQRGQIVLF